MTSINIRVRSSQKLGTKQGRIVFRIIHERKSRELASSYKIYPKEWNHLKSEIKYPLIHNKRYVELQKIEIALQKELSDISLLIENLSTKGNYTIDEIIMSYKLSKQKNSFSHFVQFLHKQLLLESKERTAKAYLTTCRRLIQFNKGRDFSLNDINPCLVQSFEKDLKVQNLEYNTISFYLRNLRAIYNKAILYKRIIRCEDNPFTCSSMSANSTPEYVICHYLKVMIYHPKKLQFSHNYLV